MTKRRTGVGRNKLLKEIEQLEKAIEWQRKDNLLQLRIFSEARDEAKHENRRLRGQVDDLRGKLKRAAERAEQSGMAQLAKQFRAWSKK